MQLALGLRLQRASRFFTSLVEVLGSEVSVLCGSPLLAGGVQGVNALCVCSAT